MADTLPDEERRISADELLELREARLHTERKALEARLAQNALQTLLLRLEERYGPVDGDLDLRTGAIRPTPLNDGKEAPHGPAHDARSGPAGPA